MAKTISDNRRQFCTLLGMPETSTWEMIYEEVEGRLGDKRVPTQKEIDEKGFQARLCDAIISRATVCWRGGEDVFIGCESSEHAEQVFDLLTEDISAAANLAKRQPRVAVEHRPFASAPELHAWLHQHVDCNGSRWLVNKSDGTYAIVTSVGSWSSPSGSGCEVRINGERIGMQQFLDEWKCFVTGEPCGVCLP